MECELLARCFDFRILRGTVQIGDQFFRVAEFLQ